MSDSILLQAYMCVEIAHGPQGLVQRGRYCHHLTFQLIYSAPFSSYYTLTCSGML